MPENKAFADSGPASLGQEVQDTNQNPAKTYTQADIDSIVGKIKHGEREKSSKLIEQERTKAIEEWREEHGLSDEILSSISKRDEHQLEIKKREKALKKYEEDYGILKQKYEQRERLLHSHIAKNTVFKHAIDSGTNDPDTVYLWLKDKILVDDNGDAVMDDGDSVENAVKALLNKKPNLVKSSVVSGGGGAKGTSASVLQKEDLKTPEGRRRALEKLGANF